MVPKNSKKRVIVLAALLIVTVAACTDPVRDARVDGLEDDGAPNGPDHRAGQPCLLCHSEGGQSSVHFAVAGTVFENQRPGAAGAKGIIVKFIDGNNRGPQLDPVTTSSGNFFVRKEDWDPAYPFRVGLYIPGKTEPEQEMKTTVNREGSCNFCHGKNPATKSSIGQIFFKAGR
jgi:hypothetical protein